MIFWFLLPMQQVLKLPKQEWTCRIMNYQDWTENCKIILGSIQDWTKQDTSRWLRLVTEFPDKDLVINYAFTFRNDEAPSRGPGSRIENANNPNSWLTFIFKWTFIKHPSSKCHWGYDVKQAKKLQSCEFKRWMSCHYIVIYLKCSKISIYILMLQCSKHPKF